MNNSDRDPDAIDRIREDKLTEQKWKWPVAPDGMSATVNARLQEQADRITSLESELKTMTSAADMLEAQKDAVGREFWRLREAVKARDSIIASLEAQLAAANAKDSEKTRDINLLTQENRQQAAQLAAATERGGFRAERLYNLEYAIYQIGRRLVYDELDEGEQESIGKELIFLSTLCDHCKGQGLIGENDDEGTGWYDCDKCGGSGINDAALAAAQPASDGQEGE